LTQDILKKNPIAETSAMYDLRGIDTLKNTENSYGSMRASIFISEPYTYAEKLIASVFKPGSTQFLDLCCGTGLHSIYPAKLGYQVKGIDISPKSIDAAKQLADLNEVSSLCQFEVATASEALNGSKKYDVIFVSGSLYYLELEQTLAFIIKSLNSEGSFIGLETNGNNFLMTCFRHIRARIRKDRDKTTLQNLLGIDEVAIIRRYFPTLTIKYFDCLTLLGAFISWCPPLARAYHKLAKRIDSYLLQLPGFHRFAFKFVFQGKIP